MPRPATLTPAQARRLEQRARKTWAATTDVPESAKPMLAALPLFMETMVAAEWLWDEVLAAGAGTKEAGAVTFALGQMCVGGRDPWAVAAHLVEEWKRGRPPEAPPVLADRLLVGDVSDLPPGGLRIVRRAGGAT